MSLVLLLARYFVHSNLHIPSRLLSPCVSQRRHKNTRKPPKMTPIMSAENEKRENYWAVILEYLDPPEVISKNRTRSARSSHKRQMNTNLFLDPSESEPTQPIKIGSQKQKQRIKSRPISNLAFDIEPNGLFTNVLSEPDEGIDVKYQAIIDTATGTKHGTKDADNIDSSLPTEDISEVEIVAIAKEKVVGVSHRTQTDIPRVETEAELPESETKEIIIGTDTNTAETGTETIETLPEEPEPKFLEVLRESNWIKMGNPRKKCVRGVVINQTGKQVYVDYGHKFYGVFKIPEEMEPSQFQIGTKLLVTIKELELIQHFMGEDDMFSLLESGIEFVSLST